MLADRNRGYPKVFSIATIQMYRGMCYSFPWIIPFTFHSYL